MVRNSIILVICCLLTAVLVQPGLSDTRQHPGSLVAPAPYEFGTVPEGALLSHTFEVKNRGNVALTLRKVQTGCSCLTIDAYDEQIPPGGVGSVSVSFDTQGYGGKNVSREIKVATSDPDTPELILTIAGTVDKVYTMIPKIGKLTGKVTEDIQTTVTIFPEEKYSFNVQDARAKRGSDIEYTLEKIEQDGRKGFVLKIKSIRKSKGLFFDKIFLTTDSDVVPEISIGIFGKIEAS